MAITLKWFEHTDPAVQNAFAAADEYVAVARPVFKAYQVSENVALNVGTQGSTYQILAGEWVLLSEDNDVLRVTDANFQAQYELKV